jgi:energy-coupling factor transport system permease protein
MSELHMGAYVNRQSAIHKLSVKLKLLAFVAMIVYTLVSKNAVMYGVDFLIIIICTILSKLKIAEMIGFLKRLCSNNPVFHLGIINVSYEGFLQGLKVVLNVVLILMWANILLCTTSPIELMNGIRFFLTPLKLFKVPVDNLTLIISVAIQFIPTLLNEASNMKKAQIARGAQFESKNIFKKAAAVLPLIIPIFVSAFKRADELSQALEARGYQGSE